MKIQFKKYFFSVMSLLILSCILIGCGESVERFEKENVDGAPSGKNLSESNNESSSPVSEPKKELDFETYLHNTTFRLGNNGRVNFQRNGKVSITGGRADLLGGYEIYDNQAVITKLQAVYGNFDASNNNGSSGYVKLNSNGSLSMTLSDGNETQSYTLEPI